MTDPTVSVVVPTKNEEAYLPTTLESIQALDTEIPYEVLVVDGNSTDATPSIAASFGATVLTKAEGGIGAARNHGAAHATGEWLAFVDADTVVRPTYLDTLVPFAREHHLDAASSRCRVRGPRRGKLMEVTINHCFSRLARPILPGFNFLIDRAVFDATGGFPDVPNEDTAYSRMLGRSYRTAYCPEVLVETSGRRIAATGLTGTLYHYALLDWHRLRAEY